MAHNEVNLSDIDKRNNEMRAEYATTRITLRELAAKYNLTPAYVQELSMKQNWKRARQDYLKKLEKESIKTTAKGISQRVQAINAKHFKLWEKFLDLVEKVFEDTDNLVYDENSPFKGQVKIGKLETLAKTIVMIQQGQRMAKGIGDPVELKKLDIAMKRLELEAKKLSGEGPEEIPSDGFIDALKGEVANVWGDEDGNAEIPQE